VELANIYEFSNKRLCYTQADGFIYGVDYSTKDAVTEWEELGVDIWYDLYEDYVGNNRTLRRVQYKKTEGTYYVFETVGKTIIKLPDDFLKRKLLVNIGFTKGYDSIGTLDIEHRVVGKDNLGSDIVNIKRVIFADDGKIKARIDFANQ